ncbi:MAG: zinc-binding dehydrogenase [Planctomycetes bacterium]|nr:zinc-binding dehydrogenase [Planctomycetota bacterium]
MKAAVFRRPGQALDVTDVPDPVAAPGEVVVRVAGCGVCHTDLHYLDHGVPTFKKPPLILGHEISGTVAALGPDVRDVKSGDRVLLPAVLACGDCELCAADRDNICLRMNMLGNHVDGGFAELVKAPARNVVPLPPELPLVESCIIADAVSTPYHAVVHRARVQPGQRVAVVGCGGVGLNAVQIAVAAGARVVAVDLDARKLAVARELGAVEGIDASQERDPVRRLKELTSGGPDVALECIGRESTIRQALEAIRRGGRVVVVGFCSEAVPVNAGRLMFHEQEVIGSLGCRFRDYATILEWAKAGRIRLKPLITGLFPLDRIEDALGALRSGRGLRSVIVP